MWFRRSSGGTGGRPGAVVRVFLSHALEQGWIKFNPALRMKMPAKEKPRQRFLSEEEILTFWSATEELRNSPASASALSS